MSIFTDKVKLRDLLLQPVAVIDNALESEKAEELYQQLIESNAWRRQGTDVYKSSEYDQNFNYNRRQIDTQNPDAPHALKELDEYLNSVDIRQLFSEISGRKCDSFRGAATIFNKGDHISDHNDLYVYDEKQKYKRVLTFNYYLAKNWNADWGGNLVWRKPHEVISPNFNTLVLFNVTANSHHCVDPVLIETENKRLSFTGWFLQEVKTEKFKLSI